MWNIDDDNDLDNLGRNAAEHFELGYVPDAWQPLQQRLDEVLPQNKKKRRFIFWLFPLLLGAAAIVWWANNSNDGELNFTKALTYHNTQKQSAIKQPSTNRSMNPNKTNDAGKEVNTPVNDNYNNTNPTITATNKNEIVVTTKPLYNQQKITRPNYKNKPSFKKDNQVFTNAALAQQQQINNTIKFKNKQGDINSEEENLADIFKAGKTIITSKKIQAFTNNNATPVANDKTDASNSSTTNDSSTINKNAVALTGQDTLQQKKQPLANKKKNAAKGWQAGIVTGIDVTTVKYYTADKPGINLGVTVNYNFNKRFALQTGLLYTIKNYTVRGSDYHPKAHYWTYYVNLKKAIATCNMWELPVNIRYNLKSTARTKIFAATGLSTYIMKKEKYDYLYKTNTSPALLTRQRTYDSTSTYWMSIMNLSFGIEKNINSHLSLQAEPFFKLPLKRVGFGNVSLASTGIYFVFKYKFLSKQGLIKNRTTIH
jgi:Outer membrane protein beta-barrel domain